MYSLCDFGAMIDDTERFGAYSKAIARAVRPCDTVAEIGCGPAVFAMLACLAGARRVYAIETTEIIHLARELAAANHLADRIEFLHADSRRTQLPERVNVIVADIRGAVPLFQSAISTLEDARDRFLVQGGIVIPQRDFLRAAIVETDRLYSHIVAPWQAVVPNLNLSSCLPLALNSESYHASFKLDQLLTEPQTWHTLDYARGATTSASAEIDFRVSRDGKAHGLCIWFDAELFENIGYSTGPGAPATGISGQMFLPWLEPVPVKKGQEIHVSLRAQHVCSDYVWFWNTKINGVNGEERCFHQSTLLGVPLPSHSLRQRAADFVPTLSEEGEADRWLLQAMDGNTALQHIAEAAAKRFPKLFPRWQDALTRAGELSARFSR